jgi:hypothetical protein
MKKPTIERREIKVGRKGRGPLRMPRLETMFEDEGDPLEDVPYEELANDLEASADAEMSEMLRQIKERRQADRDRFRVARDPDYFVVLCFQSRDQRNEFLAKSEWGQEDEKYLNGLEVCRRLGIDVVPIEIKPED